MAGQVFEWDTAKAAANRRRHGVSFEDASAAVLDPFAVEAVDDRADYGEERINLLGLAGAMLLHVTYTERGEGRIRIISARRAERHEQDRYFRENAR